MVYLSLSGGVGVGQEHGGSRGRLSICTLRMAGSLGFVVVYLPLFELPPGTSADDGKQYRGNHDKFPQSPDGSRDLQTDWAYFQTGKRVERLSETGKIKVRHAIPFLPFLAPLAKTNGKKSFKLLGSIPQEFPLTNLHCPLANQVEHRLLPLSTVPLSFAGKMAFKSQLFSAPVFRRPLL